MHGQNPGQRNTSADTTFVNATLVGPTNTRKPQKPKCGKRKMDQGVAIPTPHAGFAK